MSAIGINTVRVYSIDATKDHDGCMDAFQSQGIYVWVDLPTLGVSYTISNASVWPDLRLRWTLY